MREYFRSGHASASTRDEFLNAWESFYNGNAAGSIMRTAAKKLWNCTDALPGEAREQINEFLESQSRDLPRSWTFAAYVRAVTLATKPEIEG